VDSGLVAFIAELFVYLAIYGIITLGLNIQFGYSGVLNFTVFTFVAVGAYLYGVTSLGKPNALAGDQYIIGWTLPWPLPLLIAGAGSGILGYVIGIFAVRRLRDEFMGILLLSWGLVIYNFVSNYQPLFNGFNGLYNVPQPFYGLLGLDPNGYTIFYILVSGVVFAICWIVVQRLDRSPLGRLMRATREDAAAAEALGKNTTRVRLTAMVLGCTFAGLGGGLLIAFSTSFNPGSWSTVETFAIFAALIFGGSGNNFGAVLGCLVLIDIVGEPTRLLPSLAAHPNLVAAIRYILIGLALLLVLRFRPQGMLPERRPSARKLLATGRDRQRSETHAKVAR
jgi:branched-chain amino acid transport system permease protein